MIHRVSSSPNYFMGKMFGEVLTSQMLPLVVQHCNLLVHPVGAPHGPELGSIGVCLVESGDAMVVAIWQPRIVATMVNVVGNCMVEVVWKVRWPCSSGLADDLWVDLRVNLCKSDDRLCRSLIDGCPSVLLNWRTFLFFYIFLYSSFA